MAREAVAAAAVAAVAELPRDSEDTEVAEEPTEMIPSQQQWLGERTVRAKPSKENPRKMDVKTAAQQQQDEEDEALRGLLSPEVEAQLAASSFDPATFNPTPFEVNTPEWNVAMINFLLKMKAKGHKINEVQSDKNLADIHKELQKSKAAGNSSPLVCKTAPYNICYRLDEHGVLHPIGDRRPVRILRVY